MEPTRKLPLGIQSFEKLRTGDYLYVDKTAYVYQMASLSIPYFLSRPRRFGKSLLISTFEAYFEGRKDLFEGLAISKMETAWEKYPVLHLDLNAEKFDSVESLNSILLRYIERWEDVWGRDGQSQTPAGRFEEVIRGACEKSGKGVVVLIDEYDKPMLSAMPGEKLSEEYRKILKAFYGVLKSSDRYLRFAFLTGVTKFAQVSVFSDLNQLVDISPKQDYASLCGITKNELLQFFMPELKRTAEKQDMTFEEVVCRMSRRYDGYHFAPQSEGMFNPFSVLNALHFRDFDDYWFRTGTPTFLVNLLKDSDYDLRLLLENVELKQSAFMEYRADANNPIPLIYQSGYLTIKDYDKNIGLYTLGFPNDEVRYGFVDFLIPYYTSVSDSETGFHIAKFSRELEAGQTGDFMERLKVFFAKIPYELSNDNERHYQAIFYVVFTLIGQYVNAEVRSARGRADAVVKTKKYIYVFEFKLTGSAEDALKQIDDKGYLIPYQSDGREIIKVGVEFGKEQRNIHRFIIR
ncbi:MAG: ATP-binding protein [Dysgonamonadaceae bacterium]|jgi:hypothetical protein|nr:ATP-binding protein [Dysgonamonadaceae bacterium]